MHMLKPISQIFVCVGNPILHIQTSAYIDGYIIIYAYGLNDKSENTRKNRFKSWKNVIPYSFNEWSECIQTFTTVDFLCKFIVFNEIFLIHTLESGLTVYDSIHENISKWKSSRDLNTSSPCTALECIQAQNQKIFAIVGYDHGDIDLFVLDPQNRIFSLSDRILCNQKSLSILCFSYSIDYLESDLLLAVGGISKRVLIFSTNLSKFVSHSHIDTQIGGIHEICWTRFGMFICHWDGSVCCYEYSSDWIMKYNLISSKMMKCPIIFCEYHLLADTFQKSNTTLPLSSLHCITKMTILSLLIIVGQNGLITLWNPGYSMN